MAWGGRWEQSGTFCPVPGTCGMATGTQSQLQPLAGDTNPVTLGPKAAIWDRIFHTALGRFWHSVFSECSSQALQASSRFLGRKICVFSGNLSVWDCLSTRREQL